MTNATESKARKINIKLIRRGAAFAMIVGAAAYGVRAFLTVMDNLPDILIIAATVGSIVFLLINIFDK